MKTFKFYNDHGHGWLEVDLETILDLGISKQISACSYRDGGKVYLEEDCDMDVFMRASGFKPSEFGVTYKFEYVELSGDNFLRSLKRYHWHDVFLERMSINDRLAYNKIARVIS